MAAQMTPKQQALMAMQTQLAEARNEIAQNRANHDALRAAHDALNIAAQNALQEKDQRITEMETNLRNFIFKQQFDLLDSKDLKPDTFKGKATEAFKPWQKKLKAL